jgi:hypothetical protein
MRKIGMRMIIKTASGRRMIAPIERRNPIQIIHNVYLKMLIATHF